MDTTPHILVAEDEMDIAQVVLDYLRHAGFATTHVTNGPSALAHLTGDTPPDLTLLDVMLPGMDGLEILRRARRQSDAPILMLTARADEVDRLIGLELGADDYICKPFSPREVVARVKTVLRRRTPLAAASHAAPADAPLVLDDAMAQATLHGTPLALTQREFRLLHALAAQAGQVLSRTQLLDLSYSHEGLDQNERAVDSHIKNLRKKMRAADTSGHAWIRAVYGVGFALDMPPAR